MSPNEVKKSTGVFEKFDEAKLYKSLMFAGASEKQAKKIVDTVKSKVPEGASTRKVFNQAFRLLKKESKVLASQYSLIKSVQELGPDGYLFEKFMCGIFQAMGYQASTNSFARGKCVKHEIDILAKKPNKRIFCECKFHNHPGYKNDLKTALYVQARHMDLRENPENQLTEFWLISNTKFTKDAIDYAECSGLKLLGPNYPTRKALADMAKKYKVHPITCLTSLRKADAKILMKKKVVLTKELLANPKLLDDLRLTKEQSDQILIEARNLSRA
jgi:hypothetical protein